jgi:hypothetical protein
VIVIALSRDGSRLSSRLPQAPDAKVSIVTSARYIARPIDSRAGQSEIKPATMPKIGGNGDPSAAVQVGLEPSFAPKGCDTAVSRQSLLPIAGLTDLYPAITGLPISVIGRVPA